MSNDPHKTDLGFAVVDHDRAARTGSAEVVFGQGKTPEQVATIVDQLTQNGQPALVTRLDRTDAMRVQGILPGCTYEEKAQLLWRVPDGHGAFEPRFSEHVAIVSAGTSDQSVAEEAARTAEGYGVPTKRYYDVGVAGLHRLLSRIDEIREAKVVVVVAGMEGALPSVVAGLVKTPVVAVPTSIGYGTAFDGMTAMMAMMTSCAGGIAVVNIDNGFGAAQFAVRILEAAAVERP